MIEIGIVPLTMVSQSGARPEKGRKSEEIPSSIGFNANQEEEKKSGVRWYRVRVNRKKMRKSSTRRRCLGKS